MKKNKMIYYLILIIFMVTIIIFNATFFIRYSTSNGKVNIIKKYYEIVNLTDHDNVYIHDDRVSVSLKDGEMKTSYIMYNIGNKNAIIDNYVIENINTNLDKNNIKINVSLKENDIVNGRENVINIIEAFCDKCSFKENDYVNFDIKYFFK